MSFAQITAIIIFVAMFIMIVLEKIPRHYTTLGCGLLTIILVFGVGLKSPKAIWDTLAIGNIPHLNFWYSIEAEESCGINWATIIFIFGMMVMVEGMAEAGFFNWLCMKIARMMNYKPTRIFVSFMVLSAILAMFIDSITVILFLAAITIQLSRMLKFDPVPVIMAEIFCANLGGSATMCGDPPNIIIGTSLGYAFSDFLFNTGAIAGVSLVVVVVYFYFTMRKRLQTNGETVDVSTLPDVVIENKREFFTSSAIFALAIILLVTHASTHLTVAFIGVVITILTLVTAGKKAIHLLKRVDYITLLFFIGLFVVVGGLEQTGVLEIIAGFIKNVSGGNNHIMIAIIIWVSGIASAFVDNIPFAATMVPIIKTLSVTSGGPTMLATMAWALSMGADIGGAATPIGASANVVGISVASKEGHPIGWGTYCKELVPATLIVLIISNVMIFLRYL